MQSILYKIDDAYIFGNLKQQSIFLKEVIKKIKIAGILESKIIVFGSPNNKKIFNRSKKNCDQLMINFLKKISKYCKENHIVLCLEANPSIYNCEYLTHTKHALKLVKIVNSSYIKINMDLGTSISNNEDYNEIIKRNINFIGHAQISSPYLINLSSFKKHIRAFFMSLKKNKFKKVISVEMLANKKNNIKELNKVFKIIEN